MTINMKQIFPNWADEPEKDVVELVIEVAGAALAGIALAGIMKAIGITIPPDPANRFPGGIAPQHRAA